MEYSLFSRGIEKEILPVLRELGITLCPYGVLSRGLLGGTWSKQRLSNTKDHRNGFPRFSGENLEKNLVLIEALRKIADKKQTSVSQLAIAWVLSQGKDIVPVIGSRTPLQLQSTLGAMDVQLSPADIIDIEAAVPHEAVAGERYNSQQMKMLDSER
jgi:aryl-alcohol dehydrogenase-like predicted oxidoreductase